MRRRVELYTLLLVLFQTLSSHGETPGVPTTRPVAGPRVVLLIRHAEKPDNTGTEKSPDLSPRGFERAAALPTLFPTRFARPDFLIATKRSAHSNRPVETLEPLAKSLQLGIDATYKDGDFAELAHEVLTDPKYSGKTVMIAWHHGKLPELAHALGAHDAPGRWDPAVFDRVWQITFDNGKANWRELSENALPGDDGK